MEAMSCGIPVMATDVGGVSEIVDGTNGFLLHSDLTAPELAEELDRCAGLSKERWEQMSMAARSMWKTRYNADENYRHFYETVLTREERPRVSMKRLEFMRFCGGADRGLLLNIVRLYLVIAVTAYVFSIVLALTGARYRVDLVLLGGFVSISYGAVLFYR
jgi:hypothetical protein